MVTRRWDPFANMLSLRDAMDQLLEHSFIRPDRAVSVDMAGVGTMPIDLYEREGDYVLKAYVPGVKVDDIDVNVNRGNVLSVKARISSDLEKEEAKDYRRLVNELGSGDVARSITLPMTVDVNKIEATVQNGVLTLVLPKADEAKPKRIKITAK
ncbi:MAG: Hsp20/alpha crystallin family protein [Chloroflexi bacterium]|nr:MAG: Hsp20/alpha crystallin family protein [Chloroflexota bacterium]RLC95582.1 MAG: Hsp20/alpha crystallin family protein [Chloroflexota bacterium]